MIQEQTRLVVADNSGAKIVQCIRVPGGTGRRAAALGDVVTCTVKVAQPRGAVKKGDIVQAVIVRQRAALPRADGSHVRFDENAAVLLEKGTRDPIGTRIFGPIAREIRERGYQKIVSLAPEVW